VKPHVSNIGIWHRHIAACSCGGARKCLNKQRTVDKGWSNLGPGRGINLKCLVMKRYVSRCFRRVQILSIGFLLIAMTNLEISASCLLKLVNSFQWRSEGAVIECCFGCVW